MSTTKHYLDLVGLQSYDSKLKAYIQEKVTGHLLFELVTANENGLPVVTSPKDNIIYLVPDYQSDNNVKKEYMWINNAWELIGRTDVTLDGYVKTEDLDDYVLKSEHEAFETRLTNVETKAETNRTTLETINQTLGNKANAADVYTKNDIDGKINTINQSISGKAATSDLNALGTRVGTNEQAITALQTAIAGLAAASHTHEISEVTGLETRLAGIEGDVTALETTTGTLSTTVQTLGTNKLDASATITDAEINALFAN